MKPLRPDIIQVFCEQMPRRVCVVTNGTYPLKRFEDLYFYWISMDGTNGTYPLKRFEDLYFYWISMDGTEIVHDKIQFLNHNT